MEVYNYLYNANADYTKVHKWDFKDQCPKADVELLFSTDLFFDYLELMDEHTMKVIKQLQDKYNLAICSIGTPKNIEKKVRWIKRNLDIDNMILISKTNAEMGKSIVNMQGGIIIDDNSTNLITSNADVKICFGKVAEWNDNWDGLWAKNWKELGELLL